MRLPPDIAGLVVRRRNRLTGAILSVYRASDAGMSDDPEFPWAAVCETHGAIILNATRRLAEQAMQFPEWCSDCTEKLPVERTP